MEQIRGASQKVKDMIAALSDSMEQQVTAIKELAKALENVSEMSQSISAATEEQTANAKQVSKAVESVNELTQAAASSAEEMSSSTEQLSGMAQELQHMTEQFKIGDAASVDGVAQKQSATGGNGHAEERPGAAETKLVLVAQGGYGPDGRVLNCLNRESRRVGSRPRVASFASSLRVRTKLHETNIWERAGRARAGHHFSLDCLGTGLCILLLSVGVRFYRADGARRA